MSQPSQLGFLVRKYRLAAGLSQEDLAERSGISARAVSDIERGLRTAPRPESLRMLADGLALSAGDRALLIAAAHPEVLGAGTGERVESPADRPESTLPETRYARSGDGSVAWQVFGDGPVDLVLAPGMLSHVEHDWLFRPWAIFLRRLGSLARVIIFDKRGTGLSDRVGRVLTMEERMDDIRAVMDAAGSERAVIFGISEGGSLAALFAATHPDRTVALMIYGGLASYIARPDYPWPPTHAEYHQRTEEMALTLHERWGSEELAAEIIELMAPSAAGDPEMIAWLAADLRLAGSPGAEIARRRMNIELDTRAVLPAIGVPTMVLHRTGERDVNVEEGRYIAARIPGARFVELAGDDHVPELGDQEALFGAIESFISEAAGLRQGADAPAPKLATVMCMTRPLRDQPPDREMERSIDEAIARHGGQVIEHGSRTVLATFDGSIRATRCAMAIEAALRAEGHESRFGLHTGEIDEGGGSAIGVACRLASMAGTGRMLASATVKDISPGSGLTFTDLGNHELEGVAGPIRVYDVKSG